MFNIDDEVKVIGGYAENHTGFIREIIFNKSENKIALYCIELINPSFIAHDGNHFEYDRENNTIYNKVCIERSSIPNRPLHMYYVEPNEIELLDNTKTCKRKDTLI